MHTCYNVIWHVPGAGAGAGVYWLMESGMAGMHSEQDAAARER